MNISVSTAFVELLSAHIRREGPLNVADYMAASAEVYYGRPDVFGAKGDFITAPEVSQVFGELVGLWCVVTWQQMGSPAKFNLVECGPGRGTLMSDALRAAAHVSEFAKAADVHLVERSAALKEKQRDALKDRDVTWHDDLAGVPAGPTILIANEFLDALPIRQFEKTAEGWGERYVDMDKPGRFAFILRPVPGFPDPTNAAVGAVCEVSPAVDAFVEATAEHLVRDGGAALFFDYGHVHSGLGDTLQAVKDHRFHGVLESPGEADLTAHVDFARVAQVAAAKGARIHGPVEQGAWLERLGIQQRGERLKAGRSRDVAAGIDAGIQRLTASDAMGKLFKVIALTSPGAPAPEGFS
jgi:NADH dehydrogenase [ubiquinone] 1 alpha subcomplex assembly factor 7